MKNMKPNWPYFSKWWLKMSLSDLWYSIRWRRLKMLRLMFRGLLGSAICLGYAFGMTVEEEDATLPLVVLLVVIVALVKIELL